MSHDLSVLRAMLRLSWRRTPATLGAIQAEVTGGQEGVSEWSVRGALRRLDTQGLVELRGKAPPRLTFSGFALAVSTVKLSIRGAEAATLADAAG
jgi:hypothetical protein